VKDTIFLEHQPFTRDPRAGAAGPQGFAFNSRVAAVFDDMISRSVPGYSRIQSLAASLVLEKLKEGDTIYDLGCSTGTSLLRIAQRILQKRQQDPHFARDVQLIGIDSSPDMVLRAQDKISAFECHDLVSVYQADIMENPLKRTPAVLSLYTLQFLSPRDRVRTVNRIYQSLDRDGMFIMAEKVRHQSESLERIITADYDQFKRDNGYSNLEITRKREALQNVLIPFTLEDNLKMLHSCGFKRCEVIEKELCFATILAQR